MKRVRVRVTPPSERLLPIQQVICSTAELGDALLLSGGENSNDPTELFSIRGGREAVLKALSDQPEIRSVNVFSAEETETYVYVREVGQERTIADIFTARTLVVTLPIQFRTDGSVKFTVLGSSSDLHSAFDSARELADVTVLKVRDGWSDWVTDSLTERQRAVLKTAYEDGYYDYPRTATQHDIANAADITSSTVAEHLRNAEAALVEQALNTEQSET